VRKITGSKTRKTRDRILEEIQTGYKIETETVWLMRRNLNLKSLSLITSVLKEIKLEISHV